MKLQLPAFALSILAGIGLLCFSGGPTHLRIGPLVLDLPACLLPAPPEPVPAQLGEVFVPPGGDGEVRIAPFDVGDVGDVGDGGNVGGRGPAGVCEPVLVLARPDEPLFLEGCWQVQDADREVRRRLQKLMGRGTGASDPWLDRLIEIELGIERQRRRSILGAPTVS